MHVLANKVKTIQATKGFLVARKITKDARALLETDPKLRFVRCSSEFAGLLNTAILSHAVRAPLARRVSLRFRGISISEHPTKLDWVGKACRFKGRDTDLLGVIEPLFSELIAEDYKENATQYAQEGTHPSSVSKNFEFAPGEFLFDGIEVECINIHGFYFVTVTEHRPSFKFELDGQGRAIGFEPVQDMPGSSLEVHVVQRAEARS